MSTLAKRISVALVLSVTALSCKQPMTTPPPQAAETEGFFSWGDDFARLASHSCWDDVIRAIGRVGQRADDGDDLLRAAARNVFNAARLATRNGDDIIKVVRIGMTKIDDALAAVRPQNMFRIHGWEDDIKRALTAVRDYEQGVAKLDGGDAAKVLVNQFKRASTHNADDARKILDLVYYEARSHVKALADVMVYDDAGQAWLDLERIASNSPFNASQLEDMIKSGMFARKDGMELIWASARGVDSHANAAVRGVDSIGVMVTQATRTNLAYEAARKGNHPWVIAWLRGGKVRFNEARVYGAGQVRIGSDVATLGGRKVVRFQGLNMCSGHTRPNIDVNKPFFQVLLSVFGVAVGTVVDVVGCMG